MWVHPLTAKMDWKIRNVVSGIHDLAIQFLLKEARETNARVVILMPPLDADAMGRRNGSILTSATRQMWKTLRHTQLINALSRAVDKLDNARLRIDVCEDYTTKQCALCGHLNEHSGRRVVHCENAQCPSGGAAMSRDGLSAVAIR